MSDPQGSERKRNFGGNGSSDTNGPALEVASALGLMVFDSVGAERAKPDDQKGRKEH
jgi:hypothetical protein